MRPKANSEGIERMGRLQFFREVENGGEIELQGARKRVGRRLSPKQSAPVSATGGVSGVRWV
ncbi:UNVERIFIED_CONTAM: hypothetical protein Sradi_6889200 [Sesamum radiatum]|uniref:Uncharacterized protein n=1 Tax=Sesamum radiatum TaxID=300843 RepID=A0AAW2JJH7_SESRA